MVTTMMLNHGGIRGRCNRAFLTASSVVNIYAPTRTAIRFTMVRLGSAIIAIFAVGSASAFAPASQHHAVRSTTTLQMAATAARDPVKVGVIGCGRIGIVHLGAINKAPGVVPIVVSNPTISKADDAAKKFGVPKFTSDAMEVITDPEVDAVWICSPSQFHADQIKACAANGKHVFC